MIRHNLEIFNLYMLKTYVFFFLGSQNMQNVWLVKTNRVMNLMFHMHVCLECLFLILIGLSVRNHDPNNKTVKHIGI